MEKSTDPNAPSYTAVGTNPPGQQQPTTVTVQPQNVQPYYMDFSKYHPIPGNFTRVDPCCCACTCSSCDIPKCLGSTALIKCCCFEYEHYQCKVIQDNPSICCVFNIFSLELVECFNSCKCYYQFFCCEYICGCPLDEAYIDSTVHFENMGHVPEQDIYPWSTACCFCCGSIDSCYCKVPECLGCYTDTSVLCCYQSNVCSKFMCYDQHNPKQNLCCICARHRWMLIQPTSLCKDHSQVCFSDHRCACPYDADVPCVYMFPCSFGTVCISYRCVCKFCLSYADIQDINHQIQTNQYQTRNAV